MELHWAGWRSTAVTLQRHGWEFAQKHDDYQDAVSFYLHHPRFCVAGQTQQIAYEVLHEAAHRDTGYYGAQGLPVEVAYMNLKEQRIVTMGAPVARVVDMETEYQSPSQRYEFDPRTIFKERDSGLLMPEDTVPDLLAKITELQEPARQERLREEVKQAARDERMHLTPARIIQFRRAG